jgi:acyl carrier protein
MMPDDVEGWDSMGHINLLMAIESQFKISLTPEDAMEMLSLGLTRIILRERGVDV